MFSGKNGSVLIHIAGDVGGDRFGTSVDGIGDIDKDGYPDVLVGNPQADANGNRSGEVVVYSGRTGKQIASTPGIAANRGLGRNVHWVGDLNRDGAADFITDQTGGPLSPWYHVVACSGADGKVLWTNIGVGTRTAFGAAGDLDLGR